MDYKVPAKGLAQRWCEPRVAFVTVCVGVLSASVSGAVARDISVSSLDSVDGLGDSGEPESWNPGLLICSPEGLVFRGLGGSPGMPSSISPAPGDLIFRLR
jgi:hypothetical protein